MQLRGGWVSVFIIACSLAASGTAAADAAPPAGPEAAPAADDSTAAATTGSDEPVIETEAPPKDAPWSIATDLETFSLTADARGLSLHKPMYLLPATYSGRYPGEDSEVLFSISLKFRVYRKLPLYFGYSQKSYFQAFNGSDSKPFRDNNFNPEVFFRLKPKKPEKWLNLAADVGIEHESNGRSLPDSRSWNRLYITPYWQSNKTLVWWKWWWRIPEDQKRAPTDPKRDDNPDIQDYLGYSEVKIQQQLFDHHQVSSTLRFNPTTGRGSASLIYTVPGPGDGFFWTFYAFNGYGESLLDYDRSVTRVGIGISVAR
ncbi:MAG: phospholipase [Xanthomonadaceae bacterium]|nr:phospholipase [Xanthomonadaceae bacterium]